MTDLIYRIWKEWFKAVFFHDSSMSNIVFMRVFFGEEDLYRIEYVWVLFCHGSLVIGLVCSARFVVLVYVSPCICSYVCIYETLYQVRCAWYVCVCVKFEFVRDCVFVHLDSLVCVNACAYVIFVFLSVLRMGTCLYVLVCVYVRSYKWLHVLYLHDYASAALAVCVEL